jgi:hypothetical protein
MAATHLIKLPTHPRVWEADARALVSALAQERRRNEPEAKAGGDGAARGRKAGHARMG